MNRPKRIQRRRTRGWRMPAGAIYVGRPTKWGNRYRVVPAGRVWAVESVKGRPIALGFKSRREAARFAVDCYRHWLTRKPEGLKLCREHLHELRGHDLADWCGPDEPCHADVLLERANAEGAK